MREEESGKKFKTFIKEKKRKAEENEKRHPTTTFWSPIFPKSVQKRLGYNYSNGSNQLTEVFLWTRAEFDDVCAPQSMGQIYVK